MSDWLSAMTSFGNRASNSAEGARNRTQHATDALSGQIGQLGAIMRNRKDEETRQKELAEKIKTERGDKLYDQQKDFEQTQYDRWVAKQTREDELESKRIERYLSEGYGADVDFEKGIIPDELRGGTLHLAWKQAKALEDYYDSLGKKGDTDTEDPFLKAFWEQADRVGGSFYGKRGEYENAFLNPENREALLSQWGDIVAASPELSAYPQRANALFERLLAGELENTTTGYVYDGAGEGSGDLGGGTWGDESRDSGILDKLATKIQEGLNPPLEDVPSGGGDPKAAMTQKAINNLMPEDDGFGGGYEPEQASRLNSNFTLNRGNGVEAVKGFIDSNNPNDQFLQEQENMLLELLPVLQSIQLTPTQESELNQKLQEAADSGGGYMEMQNLQRFIKGLR